MRTRSRTVAASTAALLLCSGVLAGCSTTGESTVTTTYVAALSTTGGKSTARSMVETGLLVAGLSTGNAIPGGPSPAALARRLFVAVRTPRAAAGSSTGTCTAGTKQSQTTTSGNVTTVTDVYAEATCVTLMEEYSVTLVTASASEVDGTGTVTTYDATGAVTTSQALTITATVTSGSETLTVKDAVKKVSTDAGTVAEFDSTCVGPPGSTVPNCTYAHIGTISSQEFAESVSTTTTAGTSGANATAQIAAFFFVGGTLTTALTGTTWGISGATAYFTSASGSYGYTTNGANGTVALADTLFTFNETATNTSGAMKLSIVQNTSPTATNVAIGSATIDRFGNGTVTYGDGTSDVVHAGFVGV